MAFGAQGVLTLHSSDAACMQTAITTVNIRTSYGCIEEKEVFQLHAAFGEGRKKTGEETLAKSNRAFGDRLKRRGNEQVAGGRRHGPVSDGGWLAFTSTVFREWDLAVTPHGLLGCQNERSEAGQRLGQLQERVLHTNRKKTH